MKFSQFNQNVSRDIDITTFIITVNTLTATAATINFFILLIL